MGKLRLEGYRAAKLARAEEARRLVTGVAGPRLKQKGLNPFVRKAGGRGNAGVKGLPDGALTVNWVAFGSLAKCRCKRRWRARKGLGRELKNTLAREAAKRRNDWHEAKQLHAPHLPCLFDACGVDRYIRPGAVYETYVRMQVETPDGRKVWQSFRRLAGPSQEVRYWQGPSTR